MSTGVVVSTFGSPAFVLLQLEGLRRLAPGAPVLIHDDCSDDPRMPPLARLYGADYEMTGSRLGHTKGDVESYMAGLEWATEHGLTNLVKISRRFVPMVPWVPHVERALSLSPTAGNEDTAYGWKLRTEFIGLRVDEWMDNIELMMGFREGFVEDFMAGIAYKTGNVAPLSFLGETRAASNGMFLWYNFATAERYSKLAHSWGLDISPAEFDVRPNLENA